MLLFQQSLSLNHHCRVNGAGLSLNKQEAITSCAAATLGDLQQNVRAFYWLLTHATASFEPAELSRCYFLPDSFACFVQEDNSVIEVPGFIQPIFRSGGGNLLRCFLSDVLKMHLLTA